MTSTPVLPAEPAPHGPCCWRVWCQYCRRWHFHSAGPGHRVAHCHVATSPYNGTGYALMMATAARVEESE